MKAAIYARVSSASQRERHTIEAQLRALPVFCQARGWEIVGEPYIDDGISGAEGNLDARYGFQRLMADAALGRFDVVAVMDFDRLTRTSDLAERGAILGALQRAGVRIAEASTGTVHDLGSGQGDLLVGLRAYFAAEERRKIAERTKRGRERALAAGKLVSGVPPYGLRYAKDAGFSVHEPEAAAVREAFERVAAGASCPEIAADFNRRDVPLTGAGRKNQAKQWIRERVYKLIRSPAYRGEWIADKARGLVIPVPAIVADETWYAAQTALETWGRRGLRRTKHVYLAEAIAVCGFCGARIGVLSRAGKVAPVRYYICSHRRRPELSGGERCRLPLRRVDHVDGRLWSAVYELITGRWRELAEQLMERESGRDADAAKWAADAAEYERRLGQIERAETALLARFRHGHVSERALDTELGQIAKERALLRQSLETARTAAARPAAGTMDDLAAAIGQLRGALQHASPADRRELVRVLIPGQGYHITLGAESIEATIALSPSRLGIVLGDDSAKGRIRESNDDDGAVIPLRITA